MFVHVEHLFAVEVNGGEGDGKKREEEDGAPGGGESPEFELRQIAGEKEKGEEIGDEDEGGMALEGRVGAGEGDFAKAEKEDFDEGNGAGGEDQRVHEGDGGAPEEAGRKKTERDERGERKREKNLAGDGAGSESFGIDQESEDPVRTEGGWEFEREADADDDAESEKKGNGEEVVGGCAQHVREANGSGAGMEGRNEGLRGEDEAEG